MSSDNFKQEIATRLKESRIKANLSIPEVSEKTGMSVGNLSELENGKYLPSTKTLLLLSDIYNISIDWILKGTKPKIITNKTEESPPPLIPDNEIMSFFLSIRKLWLEGDQAMRGWIVVQLRMAFPQIAEEVKKGDEQAAAADTA